LREEVMRIILSDIPVLSKRTGPERVGGQSWLRASSSQCFLGGTIPPICAFVLAPHIHSLALEGSGTPRA